MSTSVRGASFCNKQRSMERCLNGKSSETRDHGPSTKYSTCMNPFLQSGIQAEGSRERCCQVASSGCGMVTELINPQRQVLPVQDQASQTYSLDAAGEARLKGLLRSC